MCVVVATMFGAEFTPSPWSLRAEDMGWEGLAATVENVGGEDVRRKEGCGGEGIVPAQPMRHLNAPVPAMTVVSYNH